jgi:adenylate cyclase
MNRQGSSSNLLPLRNGRTSSVAESSNSGSSEPAANGGELRKAKSSINIFSHIIKKSKSKRRLRADSGDRPGNPSPSQTLLSPLQDSPTSYTNEPGDRLPWKGKRRKVESVEIPPPLPPKEPEFTLDTNLDVMDGIVDMNALEAGQEADGSPGSDFTHYQSSATSHSDASAHHPPSYTPIPAVSSSVFSNPDPFRSSTDVTRPRDIHNIDNPKVSPTTIAPPPIPFVVHGNLLEYINRDLPDNPSWTAPESWAVEKDGEEEEGPASSSGESISSRPLSLPGPGHNHRHKRKTRRKTAKTSNNLTYKIRIHRSDNTYHVASIDLSTTVAEVTPNLNQKLLLESDRITHRLHLKERGRGS